MDKKTDYKLIGYTQNWTYWQNYLGGVFCTICPHGRETPMVRAYDSLSQFRRAVGRGVHPGYAATKGKGYIVQAAYIDA